MLSAQPGGATEAKKEKTDSGLKDRYAEHFMTRIAQIKLSLSGDAAEKAVAEEIAKLIQKHPDGHLSPVWRIRGMIGAVSMTL